MREKYENTYLQPTQIIKGISETWCMVPGVTAVNYTDLTQTLSRLVYRTWPWPAMGLGVQNCGDLPKEEAPA